ncbi:MAG: LptF/LptG family permease [Chitinophagia bacterium]|nr:LptF/LptG family permease [Chitinophagia bacterium]
MIFTTNFVIECIEQRVKKLQQAMKVTRPVHAYTGTFLNRVDTSRRLAVLENVAGSLKNATALIDNEVLLEGLQLENYLRFAVEFHRKFALSFACMLLFLIGAPLGAIIRKGGLGLPLVFAVSFFITYHMLNITGEKLVKSGTLPPWGGMWMATLIMAPIAVWLIITARNDSRLFSKETYQRIFRIILQYLPNKNTSVVR